MSVSLLSNRPEASRLAFNYVVPLLCLLAACAIDLSLIRTNIFPGAFDELEHVSYAAFLQETGRLLPKFEEQRTLLIEDLGRWDDRSNYLGHPSPYYLFIGLFLDRTLVPDQAVLLPRLVSAGLVLTGLGLALWTGRRHFGRNPAALAVFCLALALCPKLLAVSGQITNDSLGFLGGAVAYWAASLLERRRWIGLAGIALGLAVALWAKPNAGLAVGAWLGAFLLLKRPRSFYLALALTAGLAVGSVPYWLIIWNYGALVPITVEQFGNVRQLGGFASYLPAFLVNVGYTWSFSQTGAWPITDGAGALAAGLFWLMIACAALGGVMAWRRGWTACDAIAAAASLAFAVVLPIHFWFSATRLGFSLPAASFRYYLPLWPALVHALAYGVATTGSPWLYPVLTGASLAAVLMGWALS